MKKWNEFNSDEATGKYLFKFLSERDLDRFLDSGNIWFSRSDKFGDKMECITINDLLSIHPPFEEINSRKKKYLISCWHSATRESLALWDTYAKEDKKRRKVAIRFNREELAKIITGKTNPNAFPSNVKELIHGKITYKNLIETSRKVLKAQTVSKIAFRKEYSFHYESEYRFVMQLMDEFTEEGIGSNIGRPLSLDFRIMVNPLLENDDYDSLWSKIESSEFNNKLYQSSLAGWFNPKLWKKS